MSILFLKLILSLVMVFSALFAIFTMFEILARAEKKFSLERLKTLHSINGIVYFLIFLFITYFCLRFIMTSGTELSPRGTIHSIFALTVLVLLGLKIVIIKVYRRYYTKVQTIGLLVALITFGMFGTSGGYYLLVMDFGGSEGSEKIQKAVPEIAEKRDEGIKMLSKNAPDSVGKGKKLFTSKCNLCHDAYNSKKTVMGPGLKDVLKNPKLPVSQRPSTPENIRRQLREPFSRMPSFDYLSEEEVKDMIAFLNTL